jgi:hypothetical protein
MEMEMDPAVVSNVAVTERHSLLKNPFKRLKAEYVVA